ncbi:polysaccharide deacetylase family protein [Paraherbaspirillum soli]|uniref:Polysaccharide deacetylase family protein n=1 Tax=Paraherbaspirillum soli TaxID=631222 RepID=A0ABW0MBC6_9BURK
MRKTLVAMLPLAVSAALCLTSLPALADAAGPAVVAKADQRLWPEPVNTQNGFDKASRASLLSYVLVLQGMQKLSDADMLTSFKIKSLNRVSVEKWLKKEFEFSLLNYQRASKTCVSTDWTCVGNPGNTSDLLKKAADWNQNIPQDLLPWRDNLSRFSHAYIAEQLRLAALFPKVSSEIDRFNDREWNGDAFEDRQFLLTFDDGPTAGNGTTDDTLRMLETNKRSAIFFVLGENFQNRSSKSSAAAMAGLYQNQCVASHGWEHQSHAKWEQWQDSIKRTHALLNTTFAKDTVYPYFRPPYGQRKADSGTFFQEQGLQVALWNLDSQDWNSHVTPDDIINRMITLMLIKRHGIMLFHDIHPKAKSALPVMFDALGKAVDWRDCHKAP